MNSSTSYSHGSIGPSSSPFYPTQQEAATNIRRAYLEHKLRYALLMAQCQSGKTGAYHCLINMMLQRGDIQRAYILCGSHELTLLNQAHEDAETLNPEAYKSRTIQIYFHQHFGKATLNIANALVIVDESHMVQNKGQELHKFLHRHGLTMDGNPAPLNANNTYILSVDATPYSELAALVHKETSYVKHVEMLKPGVGYVGLRDYIQAKSLSPTYDISRNLATFEALLTGTCHNKYALMRFTNGKVPVAAETELMMLCRRKGFAVLCHTANAKQIAITREEQDEINADNRKRAIHTTVPCLEDAPAVTTIVIVRGCLRAGKVVPKKHIGFVWEGSKKSKTDVLVQGLPGRMCGYFQTSSIPLLFVPPSALKTMEGGVVEHSEIERAIGIHMARPAQIYGTIPEHSGEPLILPRDATNLKKSHVASAPDNGKTQCTPLRLTWDGSQLEDLAGRSFDLKHEARELLRRNLHLVMASNAYTPRQKAEIRGNALSDATVLHARHMTSTSSSASHSYYKQVLESHKNGTTPSELISNYPEITYIITEPGFSGLRESGASYRHVYVVFFTKSPGKFPQIHLQSRIAKTTGKSIFSVDPLTFDRKIVAMAGVGFDETSIDTPTGFETSMRDYLTLWSTSASSLVVQRSIQGKAKEFSFSKATFHWRSFRENDVRTICTRLGAEFNIVISPTWMNSGSPDAFCVKTISW